MSPSLREIPHDPSVASYVAKVLRRVYDRRSPFDDPRLTKFPRPGVTLDEPIGSEAPTELEKLDYLLLIAAVKRQWNTPTFARLIDRYKEIQNRSSWWSPDETPHPHDFKRECTAQLGKTERRVLAKPWKPAKGSTRKLESELGDFLLLRSTGHYCSHVDVKLKIPSIGVASFDVTRLLFVKKLWANSFRPVAEFVAVYEDLLACTDLLVREILRKTAT